MGPNDYTNMPYSQRRASRCEVKALKLIDEYNLTHDFRITSLELKELMGLTHHVIYTYIRALTRKGYIARSNHFHCKQIIVIKDYEEAEEYYNELDRKRIQKNATRPVDADSTQGQLDGYAEPNSLRLL